MRTLQAGELLVQLPDYFEALNADFRYQLTAVGVPAPELHVKNEISQREFLVAGARPGQKVCWQVTGNRKDAVAIKSPLVVERDKPLEERGLYLNPEAFGQPPEKGYPFSEPRTRSPREFQARVSSVSLRKPAARAASMHARITCEPTPRRANAGCTKNARMRAG